MPAFSRIRFAVFVLFWLSPVASLAGDQDPFEQDLLRLQEQIQALIKKYPEFYCQYELNGSLNALIYPTHVYTVVAMMPKGVIVPSLEIDGQTLGFTKIKDGEYEVQAEGQDILVGRPLSEFISELIRKTADDAGLSLDVPIYPDTYGKRAENTMSLPGHFNSATRDPRFDWRIWDEARQRFKIKLGVPHAQIPSLSSMIARFERLLQYRLRGFQSNPTWLNPGVDIQTLLSPQKSLLGEFVAGQWKGNLIRESPGVYVSKIEITGKDLPGFERESPFKNSMPIRRAFKAAILDTGGFDLSFFEASRASFSESSSIYRFTLPPRFSEWSSRFEAFFISRLLEIDQAPSLAKGSSSESRRREFGDKEVIATEVSGFSDLNEARLALGWAHTDGLVNSVESPTFGKSVHWPKLKNEVKNRDGLISLTIDWGYYLQRTFFDFPRAERILFKLREFPMTPLKTEGGAYLVFVNRHAELGELGQYEQYLLFKNQELADHYVSTHRFTTLKAGE